MSHTINAPASRLQKVKKERKRNERLCITVTDTFKREVEVLAFLSGYRNLSFFIKELARNATPSSPLVQKTSLKGKAIFKTIYFPRQKGEKSEEPKSQIRFYVKDSEREMIDKKTEQSEYKYYSDFLLSLIVPLIDKNQEQIDAYLDFEEKAQSQIQHFQNPTP